MNSHVAISSTFIALCFLNLHPHVSFLPFPQLTLPEDTQPRWGHTLTACRMNKSQIHATTFGGCPSFDPNRSHDDDPKLADTTILEFGENTIPHCTGLLFTDISEYELNGSLTDIHLGPIDCLIVQLVSYLLAFVV